MKDNPIIEINFINWNQFKDRGLVLLDFWAPWCSACKYQDKIYYEISEIFKQELIIGKINVADNRVLAEQLGVKNIPFLILLKNGETVLKMLGIENSNYLISQIKKYLK